MSSHPVARKHTTPTCATTARKNTTSETSALLIQRRSAKWTLTLPLPFALTLPSLFTLLPPLANIAVASLVGPLADKALARGVDVTTVRKTAQGLALCGPATRGVATWGAPHADGSWGR